MERMAFVHTHLTYTPHITPLVFTRYTVLRPVFPSTAAPCSALMGLKPTVSVSNAAGRLRGMSSASKRRLSKPQACHRRPAEIDSVADKLEALRSLIPSEINADMNPDQLFEQTADYIVHLKTKVFVLQKLVDFYGPQPRENRDAV